MIKVFLATLAALAITSNACSNEMSVVRDAKASQAILIELTREWSGNVDCVDPQLYGADQWHYEVEQDETDWFSNDTKGVLAADASRELYAAFQNARAVRPSQSGTQKPNWIADGLPAGTELPSCNDVVAFSVPRISGDWAFVEENRTCCGGMNKSGQIVALRRFDGRWTQYATLANYIS